DAGCSAAPRPRPPRSSSTEGLVSSTRLQRLSVVVDEREAAAFGGGAGGLVEDEEVVGGVAPEGSNEVGVVAGEAEDGLERAGALGVDLVVGGEEEVVPAAPEATDGGAFAGRNRVAPGPGVGFEGEELAPAVSDIEGAVGETPNRGEVRRGSVLGNELGLVHGLRGALGDVDPCLRGDGEGRFVGPHLARANAERLAERVAVLLPVGAVVDEDALPVDGIRELGAHDVDVRGFAGCIARSVPVALDALDATALNGAVAKQRSVLVSGEPARVAPPLVEQRPAIAEVGIETLRDTHEDAARVAPHVQGVVRHDIGRLRTEGARFRARLAGTSPGSTGVGRCASRASRAPGARAARPDLAGLAACGFAGRTGAPDGAPARSAARCVTS